MKLGLSLAISQLSSAGKGPSFSSSATFVIGNTGVFSGSTFVFTPTSLAINDWVFVMADGVYATTITGGSGTAWTVVRRFNHAGTWSTLFYRQLSAADIGATFTVNGGTNAGPASWAAYRGVASIGSVQDQAAIGNATTLVFNSPTLSTRSSLLLAAISEHGSAGAGSWSAPVNWSSRIAYNSFGPKWIGDIQSSVYPGGTITFTTSVPQVEGQVGWLIELVGT